MTRLGRPTKFRFEFVEQGRKLADQLGATDEEMAEFFGVAVATLYRWRLDFPEFREATKVGKDAFDERVVRKLFENAIGGSDTAIIFWLKNRKRAEWQDGFAVEHKLPTMGEVEEARKKLGDDL